MASIPTADFDAALALAQQVTVAARDNKTDPPDVMVSGGDSGGAAVAIVVSPADVLEVKGQLAARAWRVCGMVRVDSLDGAGLTFTEYSRA